MSGNGDHESHDISNNSGASSTVVRHFEQNFELSGFGSPGEALVVSRLPGVVCGTSVLEQADMIMVFSESSLE